MNVMKFKYIVSAFFLFATYYILHTTYYVVHAQDCGADLQCQIDGIQREIDALKPAHEKNKTELGALRNQIASLNKKIEALSTQIKKNEASIKTREAELLDSKIHFEEKTKNSYVFLRLYDPITAFFSSHDASQAFKEINFRQKAADSDRQQMEKYAIDLTKLKDDKVLLEKSKLSLAGLKTSVAEKEKFLASEVGKVEGYLSSLSSKQQELAALKAGGFSTSVGDTPGTLEPCSGPPNSANFCNPGFSPAFAVFSFGAPHRTGMSQYGAYGRSKSGQNAETILAAYYQGSSLNKGYSMPAMIPVSGYGSVSFEDNYLLGIYEVPESWGDNGGLEALKAQAVAARSYAIKWLINNPGESICTSEDCQVYKPQLKSGKWAEAVKATRGWVLMKDGQPATTYFAASSGGYTISQWGWSGIKDASGDWPGTAYEKVGGSPWFYKGWYKDRSGKTCGRTSPWLKSEELADILNARYVLDGNGGDISRIWPIDVRSCWGKNENPYSQEDLKNIGGFNSVSSVSVIYNNDGSTQSVTLGTNKGTISMTGTKFKEAFNSRAPGNIGVKSGLFNIEKI